jgi:hypothetical protein
MAARLFTDGRFFADDVLFILLETHMAEFVFAFIPSPYHFAGKVCVCTPESAILGDDIRALLVETDRYTKPFVFISSNCEFACGSSDIIAR